ncbi:MAG: protein kinase [Myxococcota bacterium]|nr:protein kinase [Myxococcota bacterium]
MSFTVEPEKDPVIGSVIDGKYRLEARLGRGGFGSVYRAKHVKTEGDLAVKLLHRDLMGDDAIVERFEREARHTHKLHHPNTVRLTDVGRTDDGGLFIAMEFVQGRTLASVLHERGTLDLRRAIRITTQILKALGEAHENDLIHRDIKPDNVMLTDAYGEPDFVKVLDFGIAKNKDTGTGLTQGLIGTPRYIAPEQWLAQEVDHRADLYAIGCLLYEMLTGLLPFEGDNRIGDLNGLMWGHVHKPYVSLTVTAPGQFRSDIDELLKDLVAKAPDARPETAAETLTRLNAIDLKPLAPPNQSADGLFEGETLIGQEPALQLSGERASDNDPRETQSEKRPVRSVFLPMFIILSLFVLVGSFVYMSGGSHGALTEKNGLSSSINAPDTRRTQEKRRPPTTPPAVATKTLPTNQPSYEGSKDQNRQPASPEAGLTETASNLSGPLEKAQPRRTKASTSLPSDASPRSSNRQPSEFDRPKKEWSLTSVPSAAQITVVQTGKKIGTTPVKGPIPPAILNRMRAGATLTLSFSKRGYETTQRAIRWTHIRDDKLSVRAGLPAVKRRPSKPKPRAVRPMTKATKPGRTQGLPRTTQTTKTKTNPPITPPSEPSKPALPTLRID